MYSVRKEHVQKTPAVGLSPSGEEGDKNRRGGKGGKHSTPDRDNGKIFSESTRLETGTGVPSLPLVRLFAADFRQGPFRRRAYRRTRSLLKEAGIETHIIGDAQSLQTFFDALVEAEEFGRAL
jgi:hypothetical protein